MQAMHVLADDLMDPALATTFTHWAVLLCSIVELGICPTVPANDLMDPAPATTFAHLDATTVLLHSIAELGIYPAVNPLDSKS